MGLGVRPHLELILLWIFRKGGPAHSWCSGSRRRSSRAIARRAFEMDLSCASQSYLSVSFGRRSSARPPATDIKPANSMVNCATGKVLLTGPGSHAPCRLSTGARAAELAPYNSPTCARTNRTDEIVRSIRARPLAHRLSLSKPDVSRLLPFSHVGSPMSGCTAISPEKPRRPMNVLEISPLHSSKYQDAAR